MENFKIVIFILAVLISLSALIEKIRLPHPVFFVMAGLGIGFIPVLPNLALNPDVVFLIFLPPLLYDAAFRTSWHDFKSDIRPIFALAVSLVFFTTVAVAVIAYYFIPGFSWPLAFLLGAIISPPDAVAASGIIKGLGLNKRVITILEGESLLNDASALIAYRYALIAITTGGFVFWQAGLQFLLVTGGGILIGIAVGYILAFAHKKMHSNPLVQTSLTLLTPFLSYLSAEQVHASGILSVVSTGLVISWRSPEIFLYQARMRARVVWDTLIFLLNGFVFILIGMQLPGILKQLSKYTLTELIGYGMLISIVTILVRIIWVFAGAYSIRTFKSKKTAASTSLSKTENETTWKNVLIISWTGTRGIISLAAALALPFTLANGNLFPQRALILFLCFVVIFVTLVLQGLSLPLLVRWLRVKPMHNEDIELKELQLYIAASTLDFIDNELAANTLAPSMQQLKKKYEKTAGQLTSDIHTHRQQHTGEGSSLPLTNIQEAQIAIGKFQRELLLKLHKEGMFSGNSIKQAERNMDIDDLQFNQHLPIKDGQEI
ncbi:MAG TPA: Na+/H+ antiporter [Chitinophagaceae bacterium]|jgi:CPA1 family monovalent cation:H+ antiporter|nr:Na+/H+ antiporter [Chitinophagaceae bacterium]